MIPTRTLFLTVLFISLTLAACNVGATSTPLPSASPAAAAPLPTTTAIPSATMAVPEASSEAGSATAVPEVAAATPTTPPQPVSTPAQASPSPTAVDWAQVENRTDAGYYERGNPDAPIVIIDYSDFL